MGLSASRPKDDVVRHIDFTDVVEPSTRPPLAPVPQNTVTPKPALLAAFPAPPPSRFAPKTHDLTATARKDEAARRGALAALRGQAVQTAVATTLAQAATSDLDLDALKSLQRHVNQIAATSTAELNIAAAQLSAVHRRQLERVRRRAVASTTAAVNPPEEAAGFRAAHAIPSENAEDVQPDALMQESLAASSSSVRAPMPLSRPRSTPGASSTPIASSVSSSSCSSSAGSSGGCPSTFDEGPEGVRAYLSARKEQLREQREAARRMREQIEQVARGDGASDSTTVVACTANDETEALRQEVLELRRALELERRGRERMLSARIICPECEGLVDLVGDHAKSTCKAARGGAPVPTESPIASA